MIQVTYDEYNQCYTKHDTLGSLVGGKKKRKSRRRKDAEGLRILINSSLLKSVGAREIFGIFFLTVLYTGCFPLPPDTTRPAGTSKEIEFESRLVSKSRIKLMAKLEKRAQFGKQKIWTWGSCLVVHFCILVRWNYTKRDFSGESLFVPTPETQKLDLGQNSPQSVLKTDTSALMNHWNQNIWLILLT